MSVHTNNVDYSGQPLGLVSYCWSKIATFSHENVLNTSNAHMAEMTVRILPRYFRTNKLQRRK